MAAILDTLAAAETDICTWRKCGIWCNVKTDNRATEQQQCYLKYWQMESVSWRKVRGLLQLVQAWVMLGLSWEPCPAAVAAMDATMTEDATSPGTRV